MNKPFSSKFNFSKYRRSTVNYIEHTPLLTEETSTVLKAAEHEHNMDLWMILLGAFIGILVAFALTSQLQLSPVKIGILIMIPMITAFILRKVYVHTVSHLDE